MARSGEYKREIQRLADTTAWEDLDRTQRKAIQANVKDQRVTIDQVAYHTGIPASTIEKRMNYRHLGIGGVDPNSLRYRPSRGFYGYTRVGHQRVVLYQVRSKADAGDVQAFFGTAKGIDSAIRDKHPCPSPPCDDEDEAEVIIPLLDGERSNIDVDEI